MIPTDWVRVDDRCWVCEWAMGADDRRCIANGENVMSAVLLGQPSRVCLFLSGDDEPPPPEPTP